MDSLSVEEEVGSSLFLVKEIVHSLSPNFGLALVTLVLMHHGMAEGGQMPLVQRLVEISLLS